MTDGLGRADLIASPTEAMGGSGESLRPRRAGSMTVGPRSD